MLFFSFSLFASELIGPKFYELTMPSLVQASLERADASPSPQRSAGVTTTGVSNVISPSTVNFGYHAYLQKNPLAVSLVPARKNSEARAQAVLKMLRESRAKEFSDYKPENTGEADVAGRFKIIATAGTDFYRVRKNDTGKIYFVIVRHAGTMIDRRNAFIKALLDVYERRTEIFKPKDDSQQDIGTRSDSVPTNDGKESIIARKWGEISNFFGVRIEQLKLAYENSPRVNARAAQLQRIGKEAWAHGATMVEQCWHPDNRCITCLVATTVATAIVGCLYLYRLFSSEGSLSDDVCPHPLLPLNISATPTTCGLVHHQDPTAIGTCAEMVKWLQTVTSNCVADIYRPAVPFNETVLTACALLTGYYYDLMATVFDLPPRVLPVISNGAPPLPSQFRMCRWDEDPLFFCQGCP